MSVYKKHIIIGVIVLVLIGIGFRFAPIQEMIIKSPIGFILRPPISYVFSSHIQKQTWEKNFEYLANAKFFSQITQDNIEIGTLITPCGDVLLRMVSADKTTRMVWIPSAFLNDNDSNNNYAYGEELTFAEKKEILRLKIESIAEDTTKVKEQIEEFDKSDNNKITKIINSQDIQKATTNIFDTANGISDEFKVYMEEKLGVDKNAPPVPAIIVVKAFKNPIPVNKADWTVSLIQVKDGEKFEQVISMKTGRVIATNKIIERIQ